MFCFRQHQGEGRELPKFGLGLKENVYFFREVFPMPFNVIFLVLVSVMVSWQTACETKHTVKQIFSAIYQTLPLGSKRFHFFSN